MCNKCVAINNEVSSLPLYFVLCTLYSVLLRTTTIIYYMMGVAVVATTSVYCA